MAMGVKMPAALPNRLNTLPANPVASRGAASLITAQPSAATPLPKKAADMGDRQLVDIVPHPLTEVAFDFRRPFAVDLAGGVFLFAQSLMPEGVAQAGMFGILHHFLRQLRRNEDYPAIAPQHHVTRHRRGMRKSARAWRLVAPEPAHRPEKKATMLPQI